MHSLIAGRQSHDRWQNYIRVFALVLAALFLFAILLLFHGPAVTIQWNATCQTIDGFGASVSGYTKAFTPVEADRFFSPTSGLGLSLLRIRIIPSTIDEDCHCVANSEPASCVVGEASQILSGDIKIAEQAAAYGVTVIAAPWSPPAKMKSSGKYCTSGAFLGGTSNYNEYAATLASFPPLLKQNGVPLYAISIQNEPDMAVAAYDTCTWTSKQVHDFVPFLSSALQAVGFEATKIAIPEESSWKFDLMDAAVRDNSVLSQVGLILGHGYTTGAPSRIPEMANHHVWQTEVSNPDSYNAKIKDALRWAASIHDYMSAGASAWMFWNLDCGTSRYNQSNNMCLTGQDSELAKRGYVLGQFAKFIRPGWQRIGVSDSGSLLVTAYKGPDKKYALVVINRRYIPAVYQKFELSGALDWGARVTPWITSSSQSLVVQSPISLTPGRTAFHYTIPARSVVTFYGQAS